MNGILPIYITDGTVIAGNFIYKRSENQHLYIYKRSENTPVFIYRRSEIIGSNSFVINIPIPVYNTIVAADQLQQLISMINYYKLSGKSYIIQTI